MSVWERTTAAREFVGDARYVIFRELAVLRRLELHALARAVATWALDPDASRSALAVAEEATRMAPILMDHVTALRRTAPSVFALLQPYLSAAHPTATHFKSPRIGSTGSKIWITLSVILAIRFCAMTLRSDHSSAVNQSAQSSLTQQTLREIELYRRAQRAVPSPASELSTTSEGADLPVSTASSRSVASGPSKRGGYATPTRADPRDSVVVGLLDVAALLDAGECERAAIALGRVDILTSGSLMAWASNRAVEAQHRIAQCREEHRAASEP